jgi:hypothetical protein
MRKLEKTITCVWERDFLAFPSYLLKYSTYLDEIQKRMLTICSLMVTGIAAKLNNLCLVNIRIIWVFSMYLKN